MSISTPLPGRRLSTCLVTGLVAVSASATTVGGVAAASSSHHATSARSSHTLSLTTALKSEVDPSKTSFIVHEADTQHGKVVGYDLLSGTVNPKTGTLVFHIAVALKGGEIFADLTVHGQETATGPILGGSGKFAGITGTLTAAPPSRGKGHVTLSYTL